MKFLLLGLSRFCVLEWTMVLIPWDSPNSPQEQWGQCLWVTPELRHPRNSEADKLGINSDWRWQFSRRGEFLPAGGDCSEPDLGSALPEECSLLPCSHWPWVQRWSRGHSKNWACFSPRNLSAWWLLLCCPQKPGAQSPQQHCTFIVEQNRNSSNNPPRSSVWGRGSYSFCSLCLWSCRLCLAAGQQWVWAYTGYERQSAQPGPSSSPGVVCPSLCSQALTSCSAETIPIPCAGLENRNR